MSNLRKSSTRCWRTPRNFACSRVVGAGDRGPIAGTRSSQDRTADEPHSRRDAAPRSSTPWSRAPRPVVRRAVRRAPRASSARCATCPPPRPAPSSSPPPRAADGRRRDRAACPSTDEAGSRLPARQPARERRLAAAVGGLAIVGATTSMAVAAQSALPGDALYPVKRAIENAQTGFSVGDEAQGQPRCSPTPPAGSTRSTELSREGDVKDDVAIARTLNTFTDQATEASDLLLADYASTGDETRSPSCATSPSSMDALGDLEAAVPARSPRRADPRRPGPSTDRRGRRAACPTCGGTGSPSCRPILTSSTHLRAPGCGRGDGHPGRRQDGGKGDQQGEVVLPNTDGSLPPGSVLSPSTGGDTSTSGTPSTPNQPGNPLSDLTDGLIGGGDSQPTSNNPPAHAGPPAPGRRGDPRGPHRPAAGQLTRRAVSAGPAHRRR